jgi:3'-5' exoribonuclease
MDQTNLKDLNPGDEVTAFFALRKIEMKTYDRGNFLRLEFGDKSGRIAGVLWDKADQVYQELQAGEVVKVQGRVESYRDDRQLKVERVRKAEPQEINPASFLPVIEKDRDQLLNQIQSVINGIKEPYLKQLLDSFFQDEELVKAFSNAVGGKLWHHAYVGGLLDHTVTVLGLCQRACEQYELADQDLLFTGAILHDIGKIREYQCTSFVDFSDEGRLRGHIIIGDEMVREKIKGINGFPPELEQRLSHLILAHQGHLEFGSPVVPMMLESLILFYADELDSKANAFSRIIQKGRADKPGRTWSDWVNLMERFVYLK